MKLLLQSDDYGISPAVALGTIQAIHKGIIRNTGLFSNMPWVKDCVEWIRPYLNQIAFGVDLNICTGKPISNVKDIPSLVQEDGRFLSGRMHMEQSKCGKSSHIDYSEVYLEFERQIQTYIELIGKTPDYLSDHDYVDEVTIAAAKKLAEKYHTKYSRTVAESGFFYEPHLPWYSYPADLQTQNIHDPMGILMENTEELLRYPAIKLVCHCGYVDAELMELSSWTLFRPRDLQMMCSERIKRWIGSNGIQLLTYKDINEKGEISG